jgi:hypothetical protein
MEGGAVGHNYEMGLPKDFPSQIWLNWLSGFREEDLNMIFIKICRICIIRINRLKENFHRKSRNIC